MVEAEENVRDKRDMVQRVNITVFGVPNEQERDRSNS